MKLHSFLKRDHPSSRSWLRLLVPPKARSSCGLHNSARAVGRKV